MSYISRTCSEPIYPTMNVRPWPVRAALLLTTALLAAFIDDPATRFVNQLNQYLTAFPQEKAYLHLDKPYYTAGETLWFKAYLVDGVSHESAALSRVLYVDLADAGTGKVLATRTFRLDGGHAPGTWPLADTLAAGRYQLRAYTNWMRNQPEFIFQREFNLFAAGQPAPEPVRQTDRLTLDLFPEGGHLVAGLESWVGFKATNALGLGTDVAGVVLNQRGDTVTRFESEHLGLGRFRLRPRPGETYTARAWSTGGGTRQEVRLPAAQPTGLGLSVDNLASRDVVRVYVSTAQPQPAHPRPLVLLAHLRGQVAFVAKANTAKRTFVVNVPRRLFPDGGVAQFTLFDADGVPLAERVAFMHPRDRLRVSITPDKPSYKPREAVTLTATVTDTAGRAVPDVHVSLAVTDARQVVAAPGAESLVSYLLLSSDLRGTIEQPGYYLDPANPQAAAHLDLLMMTQGWRRFTWRQVFEPSQHPKPRYLFEQGLSLRGTVRRPNGQVPEKETRLTLFLTRGETKQFFTEEADAEGNFGFYDLDFTDTTQALLQAVAGKANRILDLALTPAPAPPTVAASRVPFAPVVLEGLDFAAYQRRTAERLDIERRSQEGRVTTLQEVVVRGRKEPVFDGRKVYGEASNSIKLDPINTSGMLSVFDVLRGRVPGVQVTGSGSRYNIVIRGGATLPGSAENIPLFLLDGIPVRSDDLATMPLQDIEQIDVLKGNDAAIFGARGSNGVISVLSKRGSPTDPSTVVPPRGTLSRTIRGYELVREFYSPDYATARPEHNRPDYRSTLYWNPTLRTDAHGKATVRFFNSDEGMRMRVVVEGLTSGGVLGTATQTVGGN